MSQTSAYVLIIFLAFGGFLIATYIRHHKKNVKEALICPLGANCDMVIHSDYSKFMGIPLEILGMVYYGLLAVTCGLAVIFPADVAPLVMSGILFATLCAFVFSLYLIMLQAFIIKNWCTWCVISAIICGTVFALNSAASPLFSALFSNIFLSI